MPKMNKTQAHKYLAQTVEEAIREGEIPLHYLVGNDPHGPDQYHLSQLVIALKTLGYHDAATVCAKSLRDNPERV